MSELSVHCHSTALLILKNHEDAEEDSKKAGVEDWRKLI
jgi:hypothetical protein